MNSLKNVNRRSFLRAAAATVIAPTFIPASALGRDGATAPGNRLNIGVIGLGGRGNTLLRSFLNQDDTQIVALCDVHDAHFRDGEWGKGRANFGTTPGRELVENHYAKNKPSGNYRGTKVFADHRNLCAQKDLDAVIVATPDHWHGIQVLEALRAGKDVYCEKPITHHFSEGQAIYREVEKRKAIFQTGSQQRSYANFRRGVEIVRNGLIGKVTHVEVGLPAGHEDCLGPEDVTVPAANLNYEAWCGPSEKLPFIHARHHRNWRWQLAYGGGQLMDWIGHHNDIAHWGLGLDKTGPVEVEAIGWTRPKTAVYNAPVEFEVLSRYAGGATIQISSKNTKGTKWIGPDGWVYVNRGQIEASNKDWLRKDQSLGKYQADASDDHTRNFLEGVKRRKECICSAETGHRSVTPGHLGHISAQVGRKLKWDAKRELIKGDAEASKLLQANYRYPWTNA
jgi:predicted dehydrogenase